MIDYSKCRLYGIRSKKNLKYLLHLNNKYLKQKFCASQIFPYIENKNGKMRLIEPPSEEMKKIQSRIKRQLSDITVPQNVFSGIKNKSYIDNARFHIGANFLYKIDFTGFFPSISRNRVYLFFKESLQCSADVAEILTNLTTIDLELVNCKHKDEISFFLEQKGIKSYNHLISGAPTSQILSYLANIRMFDELQVLADLNGLQMSIYVDDIAFSGPNPISREFRDNVKKIIDKYGYMLSQNKTKLYGRNKVKLITGVIIMPDHKLRIRNSLRRKTINSFNIYKNNCADERELLRLRGFITACRQVESNAYPSVRNIAFQTEVKSSSVS